MLDSICFYRSFFCFVIKFFVEIPHRVSCARIRFAESACRPLRILIWFLMLHLHFKNWTTLAFILALLCGQWTWEKLRFLQCGASSWTLRVIWQHWKLFWDDQRIKKNTSTTENNLIKFYGRFVTVTKKSENTGELNLYSCSKRNDIDWWTALVWKIHFRCSLLADYILFFLKRSSM